jgi:hypothetical protein
MPDIPNFPQNLLDLHHAWHQPGAHGMGGRAIPPGQPGSGLEFLTFHRDFMAQFHSWYDSQPFADPAAVAGWTAIPPELKDPMQTGWNPNLDAQEQRIQSNMPPFTSADDLGMFIENGIHNWIHGAAANVYGEPVLASFHSPRSTYFYKIHGLVDYWWSHWQRPKSLFKDILDSKGIIKEHKELVKERKELIKERKELIKDHVPDKNQLKELKEKDKDKDIVENPDFPIQPVDPAPFAMDPSAAAIDALARRLDTLEAIAGRSFIRREERPDVGPGEHRDE